jgi:hypothetical protein
MSHIIVMVDLVLNGYQWMSLLDRQIDGLERLHLWIGPREEATGGRAVETFGELDGLCRRVEEASTAGAVINLGYGGQLRRHPLAFESLLRTPAAVFLHKPDRIHLRTPAGEQAVRASRLYRTSGMSAQSPSEEESAWFDLLALLRVERPPVTLATLVHDFKGCLSSLELELASMERPDWMALLGSLQKRTGDEATPRCLKQRLEDSFSALSKQIELRLAGTSLPDAESRRVKEWKRLGSALVAKLQRLFEDDFTVVPALGETLDRWKAELNALARVKL